jgi:hypothetical protein
MKKLLILALAATMAMPAHAGDHPVLPYIAYNIVTAPYRLVKKAAERIAKTSRKIGSDVKEVGSEVGGQIAELATTQIEVITDAAKSVKNSEFGQEVADVAGQFAAFPAERYEVAKDAFNASVDATKKFGNKIAESRFVAKVKDANQVVIDSTKKAATKVKDFAHDVAHGEAAEDAKDVLGQFADAPREAWNAFAALFKASQEKLA